MDSTDQFLAALDKSGLLSADLLAQARQVAGGEADSQAAARALIRQGLLTRWQAGQLLTGRMLYLGKYKLIEPLGKGGMGTVFLAQHVTMNRRVALKILSKGLDRNPAAMERFLSEARAIAALDHPNIVQAYSVDNEEERHYLVMEYVDGRDLQRIVEEGGPMAYEMAADAIRQAANGLAHAHSKGMIHCDIKPSNLLVNSQGVIKILDLGLARLTGPAQTVSGDEQVLGTVDYMAPEQALGAAFDHRVDIYSLGCTLHFLLTGKPPFPDGSLHERIIKHQTETPPSILERRPDAPKELVRIVRKMMAKDPAERIQTAEEVSRAMAEFNPANRELKRGVPLEDAAADPLASLDLGSSRSTSLSGAHRLPTKAKSPADQQKTLIIVGSVCGAVLLAVVGLIVVLATAKRGPPRPPPAPVVRKHRDEDAERASRQWGTDMPFQKFESPTTGGFDPNRAISEEEMQKKAAAAVKASAKPAAKPGAADAKTPAKSPAASDAKKTDASSAKPEASTKSK
jgi:serine/threonine-protein kinase